MKVCQVFLTKYAEKQTRKLPQHIKLGLRTWVLLIEEHGIGEVRKIPGYHDEPLKGKR